MSNNNQVDRNQTAYLSPVLNTRSSSSRGMQQSSQRVKD